METLEKSRERISALADGELSGNQVDQALAEMRQSEAREQWELYHRIGDVLRSSDMAIEMSAGFSARMAAALEREPAIVAPAVESPADGASTVAVGAAKRGMRRWALPGMAAAAAAAAVAFVTTPHLMVAMKGSDIVSVSSPAVASAQAIAQPGSASAPEGVASVPVVAATVPEGVVLRDSRIDDYLLAHQRFSPSVFSSAQYARSATLATDQGK